MHAGQDSDPQLDDVKKNAGDSTEERIAKKFSR